MPRVLMLTPAIDSSHGFLGFIVDQAIEISKRASRLAIITPYCGNFEKLDRKIIVKCLNGKRGIYRRIIFLRYIYNQIKLSDVVYCHMYPGFVIFAYPFAKLFKKRTILWYAHGHVSLTLRFAVMLADRVLTSSPAGCRINNSKIKIIGQGIDVGKYKPGNIKRTNNVLAVGRISPVKHFEDLIRAAAILKRDKRFQNLKYKIVGSIQGKVGMRYYQKLCKLISCLDLEKDVKIMDPIQSEKLVRFYQESCVFVSPSQTNSLDKSTLEAIACETPVITANRAFLVDLFTVKQANACYYNSGFPEQLAKKIILLLEDNNQSMRKKMRKIIINEHNSKNFIQKIVNELT